MGGEADGAAAQDTVRHRRLLKGAQIMGMSYEGYQLTWKSAARSSAYVEEITAGRGRGGRGGQKGSCKEEGRKRRWCWSVPGFWAVSPSSGWSSRTFGFSWFSK